LDDYRQYLSSNPLEKDRLAARLGVTISRFFRDAEVFDYIHTEIWPEWRRQKKAVMFSAGCAGGEEPYTLAMLWRHYGPPGVQAFIPAMDIGAESLKRARRGVYSGGSLREVPDEFLGRYFYPVGRELSLKAEIRNMVQFYRGDIRRLGPPPGLDLALCRNQAYTYFNADTQTRLTQTFSRALNSRGWLIVGAKEKPWPPDDFEKIYHCIYRKKL
jgi:chemotaxis protein methyltransferase CheR